jgi:hypothetical protein
VSAGIREDVSDAMRISAGEVVGERWEVDM